MDCFHRDGPKFVGRSVIPGIALSSSNAGAGDPGCPAACSSNWPCGKLRRSRKWIHVSAPAMSAELMKRTRVRLSEEKPMKSSENSLKLLARERAVSRLRRMRRDLVTFYVCIVDGQKARRGMGMFVSCTMLTKAFRHRSLLARMDSQSSHGRVLMADRSARFAPFFHW